MEAKALLFDVGFTLQDDGKLFEKSFEHTAEWLKKRGIIKSKAKFKKSYLYWDKRMHHYKYSHVFGEVDVMEKALKKAGVNEKAAGMAVREWRSFQKSKDRPNRKFRKALVWARMEGYKTAIVSNDCSERMNAILEVYGVKPFLNAVIVSEEVKTEKPHRKMFTLALKKLKVPAKKAVMFGDNPIADGAIKALGAKWVKVKKFDRGADWEKGKPFKPDAEIWEITRESVEKVLGKL